MLIKLLTYGSFYGSAHLYRLHDCQVGREQLYDTEAQKWRINRMTKPIDDEICRQHL